MGLRGCRALTDCKLTGYYERCSAFTREVEQKGMLLGRGVQTTPTPRAADSTPG